MYALYLILRLCVYSGCYTRTHTPRRMFSGIIDLTRAGKFLRNAPPHKSLSQSKDHVDGYGTVCMFALLLCVFPPEAPGTTVTRCCCLSVSPDQQQNTAVQLELNETTDLGPATHSRTLAIKGTRNCMYNTTHWAPQILRHTALLGTIRCIFVAATRAPAE